MGRSRAMARIGGGDASIRAPSGSVGEGSRCAAACLGPAVAASVAVAAGGAGGCGGVGGLAAAAN